MALPTDVSHGTTNSLAKKILSVDDHALFTDILTYSLSNHGFFVESAHSPEEAVHKIVATPKFDLILLDFYIPKASTFHSFHVIRSVAPEAPIAYLTSSESPSMSYKANMLGASGFIRKSITPSGLIDAIDIMLSGGKFFEGQRCLVSSDARQERCLTPREFDVLALLCEGHSNKKLGEILGISEATVKVHLKSIFLKIEARSRSHACLIAKTQDLV
jgi:two-component system nitrate/nitrite response regulator NarL